MTKQTIQINNTKGYVNKVFKNIKKVLTQHFSFDIIKIDKGNTNKKKRGDQYEQQKTPAPLFRLAFNRY